jgi:uncharacterized protein YajQ (UPF0234 family)
MPSFDVVSELNLMEVDNAFNQARKELAQRFDFKGTSTDLERDKDGNVLVKANSEGRAEAALGVLMEKLAKRGVPLEGLVKESGLKVQAAIQGEAVRISGKKRDDLQACMQEIRAASLGVPLQFQNFRE